MTLSSAQIQLLVMCNECGHSVPVNGVAESVLCSSCQHPISIEPHHWLGFLDDFVEQALLGQEGTIQDTKVLAPYGEYTVWYGRSRPICPDCKTKLTDVELQALEDPAFCPSCGKSLPVRVPPPWFNGVCSDPRLLVAETLEAFRAEADTDDDAITIFCMSCGSSLEISGDSRTVICTYCQSENFIPDPIWLRLHPAATKAPWYVVASLGPLATTLPPELEEFCDVAFAPDGGMVVSYIEEYVYDSDDDDSDDDDSDDDDSDDDDLRSRVAKLDEQGVVVWRRDDIDFDRYVELLCTPDGETLAVVVQDERIVWLDPTTGETRGEVVCPDTVDEEENLPPQEPRVLQLYRSQGVQLDRDGTFVVLRDGPADEVPTFTRYDAQGQPRPMWPPEDPPPAPQEVAPDPASGGIGGFFKQLLGGNEKPPPPPPPVGSARWGSLPDRLLTPPEGAAYRFAPDGTLVLLSKDGRHLVRYDRRGRCLEQRRYQALPTGSLGDFGVTAAGEVFQVFMPEQYWEDGSGVQLLHYPADGEPHLALGIRSDNGCYLGGHEIRLKVHPQDRFYMGRDTDGLRVVSLEGEYLYRSPATVRMDVVDARHREEKLQGT